jgi:hypothetical protein
MRKTAAMQACLQERMAFADESGEATDSEKCEAFRAEEARMAKAAKPRTAKNTKRFEAV